MTKYILCFLFNLTYLSSMALKANAINLNTTSLLPFFAFNAPISQTYENEYNFNYNLPNQIENNSLNLNSSASVDTKFNPYGYKIGFIINNFIAIQYSFSNSFSSKEVNINDTIADNCDYYMHEEKHTFTSHGLSISLLKAINPTTIFYISSGVSNISHDGKYFILSNNDLYLNNYNLKGYVTEFGAGVNILIKNSSYINITSKIQSGKLKGEMETEYIFPNSIVGDIKQIYKGNITTNSYTSYSVEINYIITIDTPFNIERMIKKTK